MLPISSAVKCLLLLELLSLTAAFAPAGHKNPTTPGRRRGHDAGLCASKGDGEAFEHDRRALKHLQTDESLRPSPLTTGAISRRHAIGSPLLAIGSLVPLAREAYAEDSSSTALLSPPVDTYDVKCLADLPPLEKDSVRLYLCRHGQTENNRLKIMQGARINPPINDNGILQAQRLGMALSNSLPSPPETVLHSPLVRARMTAQEAANQFPQMPNLRVLDTLSEANGALPVRMRKKVAPKA